MANITENDASRKPGTSVYDRILSQFPKDYDFCLAYGSAVFKQRDSDIKKNMIDLIFAVRDPRKWHEENLKRNESHYSGLFQRLGSHAVAKVQENWGARVYFNTLVPFDQGLIKYGVVSNSALVTDLLDWNTLYLAGRLHKPVKVLHEVSNAELKSALQINLHSAVHASLLILPDTFTEVELYQTIAGLSYSGDFRMIFGEDKNKISNIVTPQVENFRELYSPILKTQEQWISFIPNGDSWQDTSPNARLYHLSQLPRTPQLCLFHNWRKRNIRQDIEDTNRALANDPDCGEELEKCIKSIVWTSSVNQSLKGILTAGIMKSVRYSGRKIMKMMKLRL